jgi:hypothetical protein
MSRPRRCVRAGRSRSCVRSGRPLRLPRRRPVPRPRRRTAGRAGVRPRHASEPPSRLGGNEGSCVPTIRCQTVGTNVGICHVTTVPTVAADAERQARTNKKPRLRGAFPHAPKRTRTSTDHKVHKALNLARLPIPPPARGRASIALGLRTRPGRALRTGRSWCFPCSVGCRRLCPSVSRAKFTNTCSTVAIVAGPSRS